jgi:hypothetical protein
MKNPTAADLIATANQLLTAAERSLRKKPAHRPSKPRRPSNDDLATPEEVEATFANLRALLSTQP